MNDACFKGVRLRKKYEVRFSAQRGITLRFYACALFSYDISEFNMAANRTNLENITYIAVQEATQANSNVPAFLMKLWTLVEDPSSNDIICWDAVRSYC